MTYSKAQELIGTARNQQAGKPLANNTRLVRDGDGLAIRLHDTNVVTFNPDGSVTLDSGGWRTVTTKARMNEYAPCRVSQDRGQWYVSTDGETRVVYADGITIMPDGTVTGAGGDAEPAKGRKMAAAIRKYADAYVAALYANEIPTPSNGDCWGCLMRGEKGEAVIAHDHVESHIEEGYFVPSLGVRAVEAYGSQAAKMVTWGLMEGKTTGGYLAEAARDQIRRAITRWCKKECGIAA